MDHLPGAIDIDLLGPETLVGAVLWGVVFVGLATILAAVVRRAARRVEPKLSDVTGLRFVSAFAQALVYLVGFVLYAHLVPGLRALGTALLAGVSVGSIVLGLAAQSTLSNLVAGLSLVLYRPIRVGDKVQLDSPKGLVTATVELVSLGYTLLRDAEGHEIIVPNSVMMSSVVIRLGGANVSSDSTAGQP
ncbi:MAG TPA: mechanosensitive ion channel family protein [Candidatus Competibacteraceae bacterium]|nr:mechanosensitive ion channel family protein [Candidatus Competibacteraceae bacterium]